MKFARYLQDAQASEWKNAYIDYDGLKVQLGVIQSKSSRHIDTWSSFGGGDVDYTLFSTQNNKGYDDSEDVYLNRKITTSARIARLLSSGTEDTMDSMGRGPALSMKGRTSHQEVSSFDISSSLPLRVAGTASITSSPQTLLLSRIHRSPPVFPFFKDSESPTPPTLRTILSDLPAIHTRFFDMLDADLDKVDTFYTERAKEMHERAKLLRKQLDELGIHRQMFYESSSRSKAQGWIKRAYLSIPSALSSLFQWFRDTGRVGRRGSVDRLNLRRQALEHRRLNGDRSGPWRKRGVADSAAESDLSTASSTTLNASARFPNERWNSPLNLSPSGRKNLLNPSEYKQAKRRLRRAVAEHYRGLEVLNNYRTLNLTGFRKALKKYGKITKIPVMDAYMREKVEPSAFGSGAMVSTMLKEIEHLFAIRFEHGDRKKAMNHLRAGPLSKTYHSSTFRCALWLGLALPAVAGGSYLSFQEHTRGSLPSWNILLFIYSILVLPVLLALLIGINILVWTREKISYVFIFKLDLRSRLDYHEYFELPSFLLCTLAYAFWFSFAQIGPTMLWPLIWLALTFAVMFNPLRSFMWGARWWTIKHIARLGVSGIWEVEFADVWLGDQLCSLVYSLSNLYFMGCFYTRFSINLPKSAVQSPIHSEPLLYPSSPVNATTLYQTESSALHYALQSLLASAYTPQAQEAWSTCGPVQNWGWYYLLGALPYMVRCVQNVRRYRDSKLPSQLINAGKYGMGMLYYFSYYYWRHQTSPHAGRSYILWCFVATINAIYACVWDLTMDWGMFKPHARYPLLRPELVYSSQIPWYYFSIVSNIFIRFFWLIFVFVDPESSELYSFIVAILEMLRRVQWNFYRLEDKHLLNTGLHRITRDVPLPYNLDARHEEARLRKRIAHLS